MEQRPAELILANRQTVMESLAQQAARHGVEHVLGEQPSVNQLPISRDHNERGRRDGEGD